MLSLSKVKFRYSNKRSFSFDFTIPYQQKVALIGANGSGKSTLIKLVTGQIEAESGSITLDNLEQTKQTERFKQHIGFMPDKFPALSEYSTAEFLAWSWRIKSQGNVEQSQFDDDLNYICRQLDFSEILSTPLSRLSLGQLQKINLTQAIINKPKLLIFDEPLNGLDPYQQQQFWKLISEYNSESSLLIASHNLTDVIQHCDRLLLVEQGEIKLDINFRKFNYLAALKERSSETVRLNQEQIETISDNIILFEQSDQLDRFVSQNKVAILEYGLLSDTMPALFQHAAEGNWQW
ncbi:MAG: ABC transporter ATP-binding protein [Kangiellaceae bacterium]|jgi:ABC-2 type transport system ATP-binding protein|nr:ABC transporter ATP-binding protein [Kangiellaceae bacterium]